MTKQITFPFTKMHGLGNDFIVINGLNQTIEGSQWPITSLANRHLGVGFDQLLIVSSSQQADFFCRIFNADGSEAAQCGNGLRCLGRYIHEERLHASSTFCIETQSGLFPIFVPDYDRIQVIFSLPSFPQEKVMCALEKQTLTLPFTLASMGNLHAITRVADIETTPVTQWGSTVAMRPRFQRGINVGFVQVMHRDLIRLRTFERGVGETAACGSNACAAVMVGITQGWLDAEVRVECRYGHLEMKWDEPTRTLQMIGPAVRVFSGTFLLDQN
jgi:diaminopimelate epimerase